MSELVEIKEANALQVFTIGEQIDIYRDWERSEERRVGKECRL